MVNLDTNIVKSSLYTILRVYLKILQKNVTAVKYMILQYVREYSIKHNRLEIYFKSKNWPTSTGMSKEVGMFFIVVVSLPTLHKKRILNLS